MKTKMLFLVLCVGIPFLCGCERVEDSTEKPTVVDEVIVYVSVEGNDAAEGTKEKPFATVRQAVERLGKTGGIIQLLPGVYTENVEIKGESSADLKILGDLEGAVVFEGGEPITKWEVYQKTPELFMTEPQVRPGVYASESAYAEMWDTVHRVRYRKMMDPAGVAAYPNSFCLREDGTLLFHPGKKISGTPPSLYRNRSALAFSIARENVTLQGIVFRNYTGGRNARAVAIRANQVMIEACLVENSTTGITVAQDIKGAFIRNCILKDVGNGVTTHGIATRVENCLIIAATGDFAVQTLSHARRNGVRVYHPAEGVEVTACLTSGFWCGLRIKTLPHTKTSPPVLIRHNTFLDGLRFASGGLESARFERNLIGANEEGVGILKELKNVKAGINGNFIFDGSKPGIHEENNATGELPFVNLSEGDLRLQEGIIPQEVLTENGIGAPRNQVGEAVFVWTHDKEQEQRELRVLGAPSISASKLGAILSLPVSRAAKSVLRYRPIETSEWKTKPLEAVSLSLEENVLLAVALGEQEVVSNTTYEFELVVSGAKEGGSPVTGTFKTEGEPKTLDVSPGSKDALQHAFLRALPGDTIRLLAGVHTFPAKLLNGGTMQHPLLIEGSGVETCLFDGGREVDTFWDLQNVRNVHITGITFRWFNQAGITLTQCEAIRITHCNFMNAAPDNTDGKEGYGINMKNSHKITVAHCLFTQLIYGLIAVDSSALDIHHNTAYLNMYSSIYLLYSSRDSKVTYNSFTFTGNISMRVVEKDPAAFTSLLSDYNNFGTIIADTTYFRKLVGATEEIKVEEAFEPAEHYQLGSRGKSKRIIDASIGENGRERFFRMEDWRTFSGKDAHSIFADPLYKNPRELDFSLLPDSPNRLSDGKMIGARE